MALDILAGVVVLWGLVRGWLRDELGPEAAIADRLREDASTLMRLPELVRRMEWWTSLDVLAIDELDKVGQTDWAKERFFLLLDLLYQHAVRQETLTIVAANYQSTDELSGYLKSRIEDNRFAGNGYLIHLKGADGRKSMPKNWKY